MRDPPSDPWAEVASDDGNRIPRRWSTATVIVFSLLFIALLALALAAFMKGVGGFLEFFSPQPGGS